MINTHIAISCHIELIPKEKSHAHTNIISQPERRAISAHLRIPLIEIGVRDAVLLPDRVARVAADDLVPLLA